MYRRYYPRRRLRPAHIAAALAAVLVLGAWTAHAGKSSRAPSRAAREAIAFARAQLGRPYCWGGTGATGCFDCSGLVMEAYASAGVVIPRTSQEQWADLRHVSHPRAGDLVLAPGSDGTTASPGHVGLLIGHGRVIQAYAPGYPIAVTTLVAFSAGAGGIVGYARPGGE
jgi:cell wall-associated NlpC family hydrolase